MEDEIIETVLKEILDEIKMIHQQNAEREKDAEILRKRFNPLKKNYYHLKQNLHRSTYCSCNCS